MIKLLYLFLWRKLSQWTQWHQRGQGPFLPGGVHLTAWSTACLFHLSLPCSPSWLTVHTEEDLKDWMKIRLICLEEEFKCLWRKGILLFISIGGWIHSRKRHVNWMSRLWPLTLPIWQPSCDGIYIDPLSAQEVASCIFWFFYSSMAAGSPWGCNWNFLPLVFVSLYSADSPFSVPTKTRNLNLWLW